MSERNPWLVNLTPVNFRRGEWRPEPWNEALGDNQPNAWVTITLPAEECRSRVLRVGTSGDACLCELGKVMNPGKSHSYQSGEALIVRRGVDGMNREIWSPVSERELQQQEAIERFDATERAAAAEKAKEKELAERARAQGLAEGEVGSDEELLRVVGPEKRGG